MNNFNFKPTYRIFLIHQIPFKKNSFEDKLGNRYKETQGTKLITFILYLFSILIYSPLFPIVDWLFELNLILRIMLVLITVIIIIFIIEMFHWFYAKFDLIPEEEPPSFENISKKND
jgi:hypothetical protein